MGVDDFDALSVTDSGVFSDNDGCSSGRSSPVSCKEGVSGDRDRFAILTYEQVKRIDNVLNEMVTLEGRGNFPALELKLKDLLTAVKDRLLKEGLKIRDIRLNGGAASYALMPEQLDYCYVCGYGYQGTSGNEDAGLLCSCNVVAAAAAAEHCPVGSIMTVSGGAKSSYNDIDLIFGMDLSTAKHFDRVKTAVLDALLDLLPPLVSRKRMSACALKEAYVSKMVKVCEGDRWSLIALGNGQPTNGSPIIGSKSSRGCSVELKFVDTMRRQYEFSVDSFQIMLDSLMLFYKCATVPMSNRFYPTIMGESVYGDFNEALLHLHHGLIATRSPEEIRGGGLLKYCNLLVRGYRPADSHSIQPLQRYMCSRFFIDFPEVEQQEVKLRTYLVNHMSGSEVRLRYFFLLNLHHVVFSSTVCLMSHEKNRILNLIQRLACQLFANDYGSQGHYAQNNIYYPTYYMQPQCSSGGGGGGGGNGGVQACNYDSQTVYYNQPLVPTTVATASAGPGGSSSHLNHHPLTNTTTNPYHHQYQHQQHHHHQQQHHQQQQQQHHHSQQSRSARHAQHNNHVIKSSSTQNPNYLHKTSSSLTAAAAVAAAAATATATTTTTKSSNSSSNSHSNSNHINNNNNSSSSKSPAKILTSSSSSSTTSNTTTTTNNNNNNNNSSNSSCHSSNSSSTKIIPVVHLTATAT